MTWGCRWALESAGMAMLMFVGLGGAPGASSAWAQTQSPQGLSAIASVVQSAIDRGEVPGAVVLIVHRDTVVYRRAFGARSLRPEKNDLTVDAIFDLASLTKPIATATAVMLLVERGQLRLEDPVAKYWPAFAAQGKDKITIDHLLLHTSGLTADNPLADYQWGKAAALQRIAELKLEAPVGNRFRYSDVGFVVLGELVERQAKMPLERFVAENLFQPLKMTATGYLPDGERRSRCVPTTRIGDRWLIGEVHDPRARALGGVAGHAGLFGSADDLARFARMLLRQGELDGVRLLQADTVRRFLEPIAVPGGKRARGWDVDTAFSSPRGDRFAPGESFGHTGFTGTSLWIAPKHQCAWILLTSRVHPEGKGNATRLRRELANAVAQWLGVDERMPPSPP